MRKMQKWNYITRSYEEYIVPEDWNCVTASGFMDEKINCAACGGVLTFGESYCSLEIHTPVGFGYSICEKCYDREWERQKRNR